MEKLFLLALLSVSTLFTSLSAKDLSTYLVGAYVTVEKAKEKLSSAGYEVIASYESVKKGTTIVFTNSALKTEGAAFIC